MTWLDSGGQRSQQAVEMARASTLMRGRRSPYSITSRKSNGRLFQMAGPENQKPHSPNKAKISTTPSQYLEIFRGAVCHMYTVSQKAIYLTFDHNLANVDRFTKFFPIQILEEISYTRHKDSPPYLKYVSILPCESWKLPLLPIFMVYCMWNLRNHLTRNQATLIARSESYDYKIWKTVQQCSKEDTWCQRTEVVDDWRVTWAAADSHWWSLHQW